MRAITRSSGTMPAVIRSLLYLLTSALKASGASISQRWPAPRMNTSRDPGILACMSPATSLGTRTVPVSVEKKGRDIDSREHIGKVDLGEPRAKQRPLSLEVEVQDGSTEHGSRQRPSKTRYAPESDPAPSPAPTPDRRSLVCQLAAARARGFPMPVI